ncbi:MAG: hypothetical protein PHS49_07355 [Candidatus Gracilibacteria bacterium]|nr:hypothetical protein [Candidatus Gracilibacteria bacterium]
MIENGMWHHSTHEIGVKVNEKGEIIETIDGNQSGTDIVKLKVSNAIFNSIEKGDENIIVRMNNIYGDKVRKILDGKDELKITPYVNKKSREYLISSMEQKETQRENNKVFVVVDEKGGIYNVALLEASKNPDLTYVELEISLEELNKLKNSVNYQGVFNELTDKYLKNIDGSINSNNEVQNFLKNIIEKVRRILAKNELQESLSTNET